MMFAFFYLNNELWTNLAPVAIDGSNVPVVNSKLPLLHTW